MAINGQRRRSSDRRPELEEVRGAERRTGGPRRVEAEGGGMSVRNWEEARFPLP